MTPYEYALEVKAVIDEPGKWCKGSYAQRANGHLTGEKDPLACRFCLSGATNRPLISAHSHDMNARGAMRIVLDDVIKTTTGKSMTSIVSFNDANKTTHADVMRVLDKTIERLKPA